MLPVRTFEATAFTWTASAVTVTEALLSDVWRTQQLLLTYKRYTLGVCVRYSGVLP
jgi:hypothetical protein